MFFYIPTGSMWATRKGALLIGLQFIMIIVALVPMLLILNLPGGFPTSNAYGLVKALNNWYLLIIVAAVWGMLLTLAVNIICMVVIVREELAAVGLSIVVMIIVLLLTGLLCVVMVVSEDVPDLLRESRADLRQLESGELSEMVTGILKIEEVTSVPGPYSSYVEQQPMLRVTVSDPAGPGWISLYIPRDLVFDYDENRMYSDRVSIQENEARAQFLRFRYTDNLRIVESIEPVR